MQYTFTDSINVINMIQSNSDYVLCQDGVHAVVNMYNGFIETRVIGESCNMDEWETVESKKL